MACHPGSRPDNTNARIRRRRLTFPPGATARTRRPDTLPEDEKPRLTVILDRCPELQAASDQVRAFADMLTELTGQDGASPKPPASPRRTPSQTATEPNSSATHAMPPATGQPPSRNRGADPSSGIWPQFDDQVTHLLVVSADRTQRAGSRSSKCLAFPGGERGCRRPPPARTRRPACGDTPAAPLASTNAVRTAGLAVGA
jgi:hypothetical protein